MKNNFFYNFSLGNINAKPSNNSETLSQILYGEKFKVLKNQKNWVKIKTNFDNYIGYIKKNYFYKNFKPTFKIKNTPQSPLSQSTRAPDDDANVVLPAVPIEANRAY